MLVHRVAVGWLRIEVAVEVEEAVDGVEEQFPFHGGSPVAGFAGGGVGAEQELAVLEGDDVGGAGVAQENGVLARDLRVGDQGDFEFFQGPEAGGAGSGRAGENVVERGREVAFEERHTHGNRALVIGQDDRGKRSEAGSGIHGGREIQADFFPPEPDFTSSSLGGLSAGARSGGEEGGDAAGTSSVSSWNAPG